MEQSLETQTLQTVDDYIKLQLCHELHTSERKSFRSCRRRWDWLYNQQFYPRTTAKPLEFGVAYHKAMETFYSPETWAFPNEVKVQRALQDFNLECEDQRRNAIKQLGEITTEVEEDYNERVELGRGMISYYFDKIAPREDLKWTPVKVEVEFVLPIPNPETGEDVIWCKCWKCRDKSTVAYKKLGEVVGEEYWHLDPDDPLKWKGLPVVYAGRLDMLAQDEQGGYWIFDWKTAAAIRDDKEWLLLDDQIGSYVWALRKLGFNIRGFVYHEQLKGFPKPPVQNKSRRNGCLYSVNKTQQTDYKTYLDTVARQDTEAWGAGSYDAFLNFLQLEGPTYYDRRQVHKTPQECAEIEHNIGLEALDMTAGNLRLYPSSGRFSCNTCAYRQPCIEKNSQNDYMYALETMFVKREHYYVRARSTTDKSAD